MAGDEVASQGEWRHAVGVRDVAAEAGVSLGTVSNVLNRPERVGKKTRDRVERAMRDLGFVPSRAAGQLRGRRSKLIGVVVPDVGNPYWASVLRGIEGVVDDAGLTLVVGSTHQDKRRQRHLLQVLQSQGVDGLIIAPIARQERDWAPFETSQFGVVALERPPSATGAWVSLDNAEGAAMAMRHLLSLGHRRVALINGPRFVSWCEQRYAGAAAAIAHEGLDPATTLVEIPVHDLTVQEGEAASGPLLDGTDITAIMCVNDMLALGVLHATRARGLSIPQDVSLVGFDDAEFAAVLDPPLTTVKQPSFDMGKAAAQLLVGVGEPRAGRHLEFAPRLVERLSTSAPRQHSLKHSAAATGGEQTSQDGVVIKS